ncbi:MAG: alanine dehydrogenase [Chloroflexi bacterium]|nr:alanine dehydrogenase [Chloroflexota bacterium]
METFGIPREVRDLEKRVGLTPAGVLTLVQVGHTVYVEVNAGEGSGFSDEDYRRAGAQIVYTAAEAYGRANIVAKVTRPRADEYKKFRPGQTIFSFLHLPTASTDLLQALEESEMTAVAYEMIEEKSGLRPVLRPASEVAGRMAPLLAGQLLRSHQPRLNRDGVGILISGLAGVPPATIVIVGGGVLGRNAARVCVGLGAEVTVLDQDICALRELDNRFGGRVTTMFANEYNLHRVTTFADVLIAAISTPGRRVPILISRDMVRQMRSGSVIIDFSIDEGGCVETSRPTTLRDPIYVSEGIIHHCVPNMTAAYARTTSHAITNAALPYLLAVGEDGFSEAARREEALTAGINIYQGQLVHTAVAVALGRESSANLADLIQA